MKAGENAAQVDSARSGIYTAAMLWKAVAASIFCIWLALFGVEFFEDLGFIHYATAGMDEAMDEALDSFGNAIVTFDGGSGSTIVPIAVPYEAVYSFVLPNFSYDEGSIDWVRETQSLQKNLKINKFHQVFLL